MNNMLRRLLRGDNQIHTWLLLCVSIVLMFAYAQPVIAAAKVTSSVVGIEELDPIKTTPEKLIGRMIKGVLGVVGTIALVMIIYAGITWMLAGVRGEAKEIEKAQDTILWAVIGLAVIFSSYAIVQFIINNVTP